MNFEQKKNEIKRAITARKYESKKAKAKYEAIDAAEYAAYAIDLALYTADEAFAAYWEALEKHLFYEEQFGTAEKP